MAWAGPAPITTLQTPRHSFLNPVARISSARVLPGPALPEDEALCKRVFKLSRGKVTVCSKIPARAPAVKFINELVPSGNSSYSSNTSILLVRTGVRSFVFCKNYSCVLYLLPLHESIHQFFHITAISATSNSSIGTLLPSRTEPSSIVFKLHLTAINELV